MGTIEENRDFWGARYSWNAQGDEWSEAWDGTPYLWFGVVFPRILSMLPVTCGLEIAPGYGWFLCFHSTWFNAFPALPASRE